MNRTTDRAVVAHVCVCRDRTLKGGQIPSSRNPPNPWPIAPTWRGCALPTPGSGSSPAEVRRRCPREQSRDTAHFVFVVRTF